MKYLILFGFLLGAGLAILSFVVQRKIIRRREEEYFRRMYWTMRKAQEDAKQDKNKKQ